MTITIDPTCSTCHGSGKIMGGDEYHDCPACRLRSRYATRYCDYCRTEQPVAGMTFFKGEYGNTYTACEDCANGMIEDAHEASVEAEYRA